MLTMEARHGANDSTAGKALGVGHNLALFAHQFLNALPYTMV